MRYRSSDPFETRRRNDDIRYWAVQLSAPLVGRFVDHDMAGRDQIQEVVMQVKEPRSVGQWLPVCKRLGLRDTEEHFVNGAHRNLIPSFVIFRVFESQARRAGARLAYDPINAGVADFTSPRNFALLPPHVLLPAW